MQSSAITVLTTPTTLASGGAWINQKNVLIYNGGADTIHVGDSSVTTSTGIPVAASGSLAVDLLGDTVCAIAQTAQTTTLTRVLTSG